MVVVEVEEVDAQGTMQVLAVAAARGSVVAAVDTAHMSVAGGGAKRKAVVEEEEAKEQRWGSDTVVAVEVVAAVVEAAAVVAVVVEVVAAMVVDFVVDDGDAPVTLSRAVLPVAAGVNVADNRDGAAGVAHKAVAVELLEELLPFAGSEQPSVAGTAVGADLHAQQQQKWVAPQR